jgi:pimeloyl-ACP methyl ester carboxylesterase
MERTDEMTQQEMAEAEPAQVDTDPGDGPAAPATPPTPAGDTPADAIPAAVTTEHADSSAIDPNALRYRAGVRREGAFGVRYVTVHGYRRAYVKAGSGPVLLLIHGIGDSSDSWRPVVEQLAEHHTVVAPDLLGHGRSEKPRADYTVTGYANGMRDLLSVLEIDRATVLGHSLGGGVAAQFAYQFPERCERLVLVGSGGVGRSVSPLLRMAAIPGAEALMPFLGTPPVKLLSRVGANLLRILDTALGRDAEEMLAVFDALPNTEARRTILRTLRSGVDWRGQVITMLDRAYLAEGVPTLIIWGRRDAIIPLGHARLAHLAFPGSELEIFDEAGHFPHHSDPARFVRVVREFVRATEPAEYAPEDWRDRLAGGGIRPKRKIMEAAVTEHQMLEPPDAPVPGTH